jgi:DNA-binding transcriptional ArsR family regulator
MSLRLKRTRARGEMGRPRYSQPLPPVELIRAMFEVRDGALISRRTGETALVEKGIDGYPMIRLMVEGQIRRFAIARVAWVVQFGAWPKGIIRLRSDAGGYSGDNLIETRRGQNPFAVGRASLIKRAERDASLLQAMARSPGATVPTLSRLAGVGATCACVRLSALADRGLCVGPKCDARARWDLTPAGRALAAATHPVVLDDRDRQVLSALAVVGMGITKLSRRSQLSPQTIRRRLRLLVERGLVFADPRKFFSITHAGLAALPDAPKRWVNSGVISAVSARDVVTRSPTDDRNQTQLAANARLARGRPRGGRQALLRAMAV